MEKLKPKNGVISRGLKQKWQGEIPRRLPTKYVELESARTLPELKAWLKKWA